MPRSPAIPLGLAALKDFPPKRGGPPALAAHLLCEQISPCRLRDWEALRAFARTSLVVLGSMPFILRCPLA